MAYDPQPFVATQSGSAEDAPSSAKPIALYGAGSGGGGGLNQLDELLEDKADNSVTLYIQDPELEGSYLDYTQSVSEWLGYLYGLIVPVPDPGE